MKENRIQSFDIKICLSQRQQLRFCVVRPTDQVPSETDIDTKIGIFIDYHLAIRPQVPVILFELENLINVGAPLYKHQDITVYHVPPANYRTLEESIEATDFLVSHTLLKKIIEGDKIYASILDSLDTIYAEDGLNVLGFHNESEKT